MKVRYTGKTDPIGLQNGKIYDVIEVSEHFGWYRIVTEFDDDDELDVPPGYLYPPDDFEIMED